MKIEIKNKFGFKTDENNKHFPLLYFAYGGNGFIITIFCIAFIFKKV